MVNKSKLKTPFCKWLPLSQRRDLPGKEYPGVYIIAKSPNLITGKFGWRKDIVYVGMSLAKAGLKSRLQQFLNAIRGGSGHGPAERHYKRLYKKGYTKKKIDEYVNQLYVSTSYTECDVTKINSSSDLEQMGIVVKQEYDCLADYVKKFKRLPKINQKN